MNIVVALLVFGIIVLVHEFGHFFVAKRNGIFVEEFAIGMGPKLLSRKIGETIYSIRMLPLGGFCKMMGEESESGDARAFSNKSVGVRMSVIAAGPFMNFLLAFIIIAWIAMAQGFSTTVIDKLDPDYPAAQAGLQVGDKITALNGRRIYNMQDLMYQLHENKGNPITIDLIRSKQTLKRIPLAPKWDEQNQQWRIGFTPIMGKQSLGETFVYSFWSMIYLIKMTVVGFVRMFSGQVPKEQIAGPIGIFQIIGESYQVGIRENILYAIRNVAYIAALLSANLGALNLFPIPALDGSRLVFLGIEGIRKKPVSIEKESMIHFIGFVLLMVLMVFVAYNDIIKLF